MKLTFIIYEFFFNVFMFCLTLRVINTINIIKRVHSVTYVFIYTPESFVNLLPRDRKLRNCLYLSLKEYYFKILQYLIIALILYLSTTPTES